MPDVPPDVAPSAEAPPADAGAFSYRAELMRKALHLLSLVVPLGMAWLGKPDALYVLAPSALIAVAADVWRSRSAAFNRRIRQVFGPLMRADELPEVGQGLSINGATCVLVSATLLTFIFPLRVAVPVFVMFMISDAAAAVVGRRIGRWHWGRSPRTVEGTLAFLLVGLGVMALFPAVSFWVGAAGVGAAAATEAVSIPINDNIRVPLVAAAVVCVLEWSLLGLPVDLFL